MLTGCASFDKTPEGYADLVYTKTEYNPYLSYAVNISLLAMDLRGFRYEISPVKAGSEDTEGYDSYPTPIEATDSAGFVVTKTTTKARGSP